MSDAARPRARSRPFSVVRCAGCGRAAWPAPALCARCGGRDFAPDPAPDGVLEDTTTVAGAADGEPVTLGTVRTCAGPLVIARVVGARPGDPVALRVRDGALEARRPRGRRGAA